MSQYVYLKSLFITLTRMLDPRENPIPTSGVDDPSFS